MANNCQISTPREYVVQMLKYIKYKDNIYGKRILENSCGEGNILEEVVKRYIKDARNQAITESDILKGLERDIIAYEIDKNKINLCIIRLNKLVKSLGFRHVNWNINNEDFLRNSNEKYDYIIGNPPYITYHDLGNEQREYLKNNFESCKEGRFDYSYAFIEKSINSLEQNGKLVYILPYSIIKNKFAGRLREYISPYITSIYDYTGIKVFSEATISSIVLLMENKNNKKNVQYYGMINKCKRNILRTNLKGKWKFIDEEAKGKKRFGDYFDVSNSIATLFNKAYIIENYTIKGKYYYVDGMKIEKQLVYPAISIKSYNKTKQNNKNLTAIIFPYKVKKGEVFRFSKEDFEKKFPETVKYLKRYISELSHRKSDEKAQWFEYGRNQAINRVFGEKLVMPMVITNKVSVCQATSEMIPYAGYFIKCAEDSDMTLEQALQILESNKFYEYVKAYGTPTTPTSYRISVDDIKEYRF